MLDINTTLFLWLNASAASPTWILPLARFASLELTQWLLAGTVGAFMVGDARTRRMVVRVLVAMAIAWLIARLTQHLWPMPRPFALGLGTAWLPHGDSAGFPSTHASVAFAFAVAVSTCARRWPAVVAAFSAAALITWSRVSLGLHFPFDAMAGMLVGIFSAWLCVMVPRLARRGQTAHE